MAAALTASTCAWTWAMVAPGFNLPMLPQLLLCRALSDSCSGVNASGVHIRTFGSTNRNASGMTPTIVKGLPSRRSWRPTTPRSPAKRSCQNAWLSSTLSSCPISPSSSVKVRPSWAFTRVTRKNDGVTLMLRTRSGLPLSPALRLAVLNSESASRAGTPFTRST